MPIRSLLPALRLLCWLLVLGTLILSAGAASYGDEIGTPAQRAARPLMHFRVMWMHDPATKAVVSWTSGQRGSNHRVYFDTEPRQGVLSAYAHQQPTTRSGRFTMVDDDRGTPAGFYHHALLDELEPATTYYFVVASDGQVSREFHFVTAPEDDRPIKLLFGGDSRRPPSLPAAHTDRRAINRMIAEMVDEDPEILALFHGGDYCTRAQWRFMTDWLSDHELTITDAGRILPIIPARGNHDRDVVFEEMFYWPNRDHDYYYATELTEKIVLLTLNTEISKAGDQRNWLEDQLRHQREEDKKWIIVQYHVPSYGSVKSYRQGDAQRLHWVPLFEQFDVDLVCEADHHSLKRTVPIRNDQHDPERGIVYIGDGGMGVPQRTPDPSRWYLQSPGMTTSAHHIHRLELGQEQLRVEAIGLDRETLDAFTLTPKAPLAAAAGK